MTKIVRFTDVTFNDGVRCFDDIDFGRHSIAEVMPYDNEDQTTHIWEIVNVLCCPGLPYSIDGGGWVLRPEEVEEVTQDEIDAAIAYNALMGQYVGELL